MRKLPFILWLPFLIHTSLFAQSPCQCTEPGEAQAGELLSTNDSSLIYKTINRLRKSENSNCRVISYTIEADYLLSLKKKAELPVVISEQEKLINSLSCKDELIVHSLLNHAGYCRIMQDYEGLSDYAFRALAAAEANADKKKEFRALTFIVLLNIRQKQYEKTWAYTKRAEKIVLGLKPDYSLSSNYNWLAFQYEFEYSRQERKGLMDSAIMYARIALTEAQNSNNYNEIINAYRIFESHAASNEDYKSALRYSDSAISYVKQVKTPLNPGPLYLTRALEYTDLNNYPEAQRWADSAIYYSEKSEGRSPATLAVYNQALMIFEETGNLAKTITLMKMQNKLKDSLFKQERLEKINELEEKYNKSRNEKTIKELAQEKSIYLLLALAGVLGIASIAFFLRQQSLKNKKLILEAEQRLNTARMNPHFFFNALSALQKFALKEHDGQAMASNLSKFSNIMRETLESTYKEYVTVEQEIEFLEEYLEVQKIMLPQTFSYTITAEKELETDALLIPAMIIQPFVENSIEHGFAGVGYAGTITISFKNDNKSLLITITDNGKGLATTAKESNEHISRASQIIKERIYLLNIKLKTKAGFSIDNAASGKGVIVKINLPLLYKNQTN